MHGKHGSVSSVSLVLFSISTPKVKTVLVLHSRGRRDKRARFFLSTPSVAPVSLSTLTHWTFHRTFTFYMPHIFPSLSREFAVSAVFLSSQWRRKSQRKEKDLEKYFRFFLSSWVTFSFPFVSQSVGLFSFFLFVFSPLFLLSVSFLPLGFMSDIPSTSCSNCFLPLISHWRHPSTSSLSSSFWRFSIWVKFSQASKREWKQLKSFLSTRERNPCVAQL